MNLEPISEGAKLDIAASSALLICIILVAVSIETSAPAVAAVGAFGAAATGIVRVALSAKRKH